MRTRTLTTVAFITVLGGVTAPSTADSPPGLPLGAVLHAPWKLLHHPPCRKGCTHSPDHCWSPPIKQPMRRVPIQYMYYWPQTWFGQSRPYSAKPVPTYPTVYLPTDTTQLGYYYNRVPQWQPNPAMLPAPPSPAVWHRRVTATAYRRVKYVRPVRVYRAMPVPHSTSGPYGMPAPYIVPAKPNEGQATEQQPTEAQPPATQNVPDSKPPTPPAPAPAPKDLNKSALNLK